MYIKRMCVSLRTSKSPLKDPNSLGNSLVKLFYSSSLYHYLRIKTHVKISTECIILSTECIKISTEFSYLKVV